MFVFTARKHRYTYVKENEGQGKTKLLMSFQETAHGPVKIFTKDVYE